jgi:hypothetical protein
MAYCMICFARFICQSSFVEFRKNKVNKFNGLTALPGIFPLPKTTQLLPDGRRAHSLRPSNVQRQHIALRFGASRECLLEAVLNTLFRTNADCRDDTELMSAHCANRPIMASRSLLTRGKSRELEKTLTHLNRASERLPRRFSPDFTCRSDLQPWRILKRQAFRSSLSPKVTKSIN